MVSQEMRSIHSLGTTTEAMDTAHLDADEPEVAKSPVNDNKNDDDNGNGTTMDLTTATWTMTRF